MAQPKRNSADVAAERDLEIDRRLGTETPQLGKLSEALFEAYTAEAWGFDQFSAIADEEQRAVASDLTLSAVEGVEVNLREMALCLIDLDELVGPNGRTMPGPETTVEELIDGKRTHRAVTDFTRAFGSNLDCLAAATIAVLCLPSSIQSASGASLLNVIELPAAAPASQQEARGRAANLIEAHAERDPAGWLAWMLELRNAVVHRGHLTGVWMTMPRKGSGPQLAVWSETGISHLIRMQPHLRGKPWQPDMLSLTGPETPANALIWLPEPTTATLREVKVRAVALAEELSELLLDLFTGERTDWELPEAKWRLERVTGRPREAKAAQFKGFDPDYPAPPPSEMRVHPRSAQRLELAERLRQASQEAD